jgi:hypothetical protein
VAEQTSPKPPGSSPNFFDVYVTAIEDLQRTKEVGQRIDSLYVTILTLLFTADAYEIATTKFDSWAPVVATSGVAIIGIAIVSRWRKGVANLFKIIANRYKWLRIAEQRPDMKEIAADIFTQEWLKVYVPQMSKKEQAKARQPQEAEDEEPGFSTFYPRTLFLQSICPIIFIAVPAILAVVTYFSLSPAYLQPIERLFGGL